MQIPIVSIGFPSEQSAEQNPVIAAPQANTGKTNEETAYKIPPVVWMFVFLIAGYVGVRLVMED